MNRQINLTTLQYGHFQRAIFDGAALIDLKEEPSWSTPLLNN